MAIDTRQAFKRMITGENNYVSREDIYNAILDQYMQAYHLCERMIDEVVPEYSERSGDIYCIFCGHCLDDWPHADDCIYVLARGLVEVE